MIKRYAIPEITKIWSIENTYELYQKVEGANLAALVALKLIDASVYQKYQSKTVTINPQLVHQEEVKTNHDFVAFLNILNQQHDPVVQHWLHYGLTTNDVRDTTTNMQIKASHKIVWHALNKVNAILLEMAHTYKKQFVLARTHGQAAEITSLGLRFLLFYDALKRQQANLKHDFKGVSVVKFSGAVGNFAHIDPRLEKKVAQLLALDIDTINTQVTSRQRYQNYFYNLTAINNILHSLALQIRLSAISEVNELQEGFSKEQIGSSAMPHKKNPISCEQICGLAEYATMHNQLLQRNSLLWWERDISHSSNERLAFPNLFHVTIYLLNKMQTVLNDLVVNQEAIAHNIEANKHLYYSQMVMNYLVMHSKIPRLKIYSFIKKASHKAIKEKKDFFDILRNSSHPFEIDWDKIIAKLNNDLFIKNIDYIFNKINNFSYE